MASDIHLDKSSLLRKKWSPLRCVPPSNEEISSELALVEPLALVQELPCFDDSIKMDPLLSSALDLCVHNLIIGCLLYAVGFELCWCQLFHYF